MKRRLLAILLSLTLMLSLVPSAWAENEGDAEPYGAEGTSAVDSKDGLSGPCGATEDDTVAWALTEK